MRLQLITSDRCCHLLITTLGRIVVIAGFVRSNGFVVIAGFVGSYRFVVRSRFVGGYRLVIEFLHIAGSAILLLANLLGATGQIAGGWCRLIIRGLIGRLGGIAAYLINIIPSSGGRVLPKC